MHMNKFEVITKSIVTMCKRLIGACVVYEKFAVTNTITCKLRKENKRLFLTTWLHKHSKESQVLV